MKRSNPPFAGKGRRHSSRRRHRFESLESRRLLASLAGQVWDDLNANGMMDAGEEGLAEVRVYLDANDNGTREATEDFDWTAADGSYVIDNLAAGDYVIRMEPSQRIQQTSPNEYLGMADAGTTGQTQLFEMDRDGTVRRIGDPTATPIFGLARTKGGQMIGSNHQDDTFYTLDPQSGAASLLAPANEDIVAGLAYDAANDTIYTVGRGAATPTVQQLLTVDATTGQTTAIGPGIDGGPASISDLTFDPVNDRVVGFDNTGDSFYAFDLSGNFQQLGTIAGGFDSWSLAFNGSEFIMMDQGDAAKQRAVMVDVDAGIVSDAFTASEAVPSEALFFATHGDVAHRLTLADTDDIVDLHFGVEFDAGADFDRRRGRVAFINELFLDPVFSLGGQTEQYLELRGKPNQQLPLGTYFVALGGSDYFSSNDDEAGKVLTIIDLSNQRFGANGMLVLLPQNSPFQPHPEANVLRSGGPGFSGLPGNIFQTEPFGIWGDESIAHFGSRDFSYLLIQSDTPPTISEDVDNDDDGEFDFTSPADDWTVYDSVSIHSFVGLPSVAYGSVIFYNSGRGAINVNAAADATLIPADDVGYVGRIGDSVGYTKNDWIGSSVRHNDSSTNLRYYLEDGIYGPPRPYAYQGRFLDHVGDSNFVGAVRGTVARDLNGNDVADPGEPPLVDITVLADTNNNGTRDNLSFTFDPDSYADGTDVRNLFPGVTLTQANSESRPTGGSINADRPFLSQPNDHVFARGGIDWFTPSSQLRFDFYRPVNTVAIDVIGGSNFTATYGRLEAFNSDDESLGFVHSSGLADGVRETLQWTEPDDVIAYAVAYSDTDFMNSFLFGQFDRLQYSQFEAAAVTDENGDYVLGPLVVNSYDVRLTADTVFQIGAQPRPIRVERYDNFDIDFAVRANSPPQIDSASFTLDEHRRAGTVIGTIAASDPDVGQEVRYRIVGGSAADAVSISPQGGQLRVRRADLLDFESSPQELVIVEAFDPFGASATAAATISLNNINDQPDIDTEELFVSEGTAAGVVFGQILFSDQDAGANGMATIRVVGGTAEDVVSVDPDTGAVTLEDAAAIDFETNPMLTLRVTAVDQADPPRNRIAEIKLLVRDVNEQPSLTTSLLTVAETVSPGDPFGVIEVNDPDAGQNHFFRVQSGSGASLFQVDRNSGVVSLAPGASLDFESVTSYTLDVLVSDNGSPALSDASTIEIRLSDVNEPPFLVENRFAVSEAIQAGDLVAQLSAIDPDPSQSLEFQLTGGSGQQQFRLDTNGSLRVAPQAAAFDFETTDQYNLMVQITDDGVPVAAASYLVLIDVVDVPEAPVITTTQITVPEDALPGASVGSIVATDADADDRMTFSIVGGSAANRLEIDAQSGALLVASDGMFDHETEPELTLIVEVTDQLGHVTQQTVTVHVADRNERPLIISPVDNKIVEAGKPFDMTFADDLANDPDVGQSLTYTISALGGSFPSWLQYDPATRMLTGFPNQTNVGSTAVALRVSDGFASAVQVFNIIVRPSERPFQNGRDPLDVDNNQEVNAADALRVINYMNRFGIGPINPDTSGFPGFVDTDGDGQATPRDVLLIINRLNRRIAGGEGEALASDPDRDAVDAAAASTDAAMIDLYGDRSKRRKKG